jgi:hypothetical protein
MRSRRSHGVWITAFFLYFFLVTIPNAHAYIDPGTGSYLFQLAVGAVLGVAVAVKLFWKRLWGFFTGKSRSPADKPEQVEPVEQVEHVEHVERKED